ncbi:Oidioi.mRNA.OKI2018_I69.chr2.g7810.t1.cds [Oikopleura dioica]|uniref:Oidioi.mRNA.OKI2018_I69.chr2.g7810.t1.cds n=1 Tax=Oikopleura dioica TaxID=34765 RepID=A0ABN7TDW2_OIKDI|nr:Oidioi.mRNA.OKI2018_I69.chr2.g7810.t1.cds [Oikopleura dioica]
MIRASTRTAQAFHLNNGPLSMGEALELTPDKYNEIFLGKSSPSRDPRVRAMELLPAVDSCALGPPSSAMTVAAAETLENVGMLVLVLISVSTCINCYSIHYFVNYTMGLYKKKPIRAGYIDAILRTPPVCCLCSLMILLSPRIALFMTFILNFTFGLSINALFSLILDYFDSFDHFLNQAKKTKWSQANTSILECFRITPSREWFSQLYWGSLQCVFVRCAFIIANACFVAEGIWTVDTGSISSLFGGLVSTGLAVFCLIVLSENLNFCMADFHIKFKFMLFRLTLISVNIQPIIISFFNYSCVYPHTAAGRGTILHNALVVIEMFLVSLLYRYVFMYKFVEDKNFDLQRELVLPKDLKELAEGFVSRLTHHVMHQDEDGGTPKRRTRWISEGDTDSMFSVHIK